jgi:hypothetical protein
LYVPGENHRCEHSARFPVGGELGQYLRNAYVCKEHLKYLLRHADEWLEAFRKAKIPKGENLAGLQDLYRKQSIMSELS